MRRTILALFILLVGMPYSAAGQEVEENVTDYEFEDELVAGDLFNPNGEVLNVLPKKSSRSLIRAREHFVPEMLKSVERL
jgi:hypothetical protein